MQCVILWCLIVGGLFGSIFRGAMIQVLFLVFWLFYWFWLRWFQFCRFDFGFLCSVSFRLLFLGFVSYCAYNTGFGFR